MLVGQEAVDLRVCLALLRPLPPLRGEALGDPDGNKSTRRCGERSTHGATIARVLASLVTLSTFCDLVSTYIPDLLLSLHMRIGS